MSVCFKIVPFGAAALFTLGVVHASDEEIKVEEETTEIQHPKIKKVYEHLELDPLNNEENFMFSKSLGISNIHNISVTKKKVSVYYNKNTMDRLREAYLTLKGSLIKPKLEIQCSTHGRPLTNKDFDDILSVKPKELTLIHAQIDDKIDVEKLIENPNFKNLESFRFSDVSGIKNILKDKKIIEKVKGLYINRFSGVEMELPEELAGSKFLKSLEIMHAFTREIPPETISKILKNKDGLHKLTVRYLSSNVVPYEETRKWIESTSQLEEVQLSDRMSSENDEDIKIFFSNLSKQRYLKNISLSFDPVKESLLASFVKFLKQSPQLESLSLSVKMEAMDLDKWKKIIEGLETLTNVQKFHIYATQLPLGMTAEEMKNFIPFFKNNEKLEDVKMHGLKGDTLKVLLKSLESNSLTKFSLAYSDLSKNTKDISLFLKNQLNLKELNLPTCRVQNEGVPEIIKALSDRDGAIQVDLSYNPIGIEGIESVKEAARKGEILKEKGDILVFLSQDTVKNMKNIYIKTPDLYSPIRLKLVASDALPEQSPNYIYTRFGWDVVEVQRDEKKEKIQENKRFLSNEGYLGSLKDIGYDYKKMEPTFEVKSNQSWFSFPWPNFLSSSWRS